MKRRASASPSSSDEDEARVIFELSLEEGRYIAMCFDGDVEEMARDFNTSEDVDMRCVAAYDDKRCDSAVQHAWRAPGAMADARAVSVFEDQDEPDEEIKTTAKDEWRAAIGRMLRAIYTEVPRFGTCIVVFEGGHLSDLADVLGSEYSFRALCELQLIECHMPSGQNAKVLVPWFACGW